MKGTVNARRALSRADQASSEIDRSLWLAMAADHAVKRRAVLVGGAAVNLYTGSYRPTDIDMCAYLDDVDRERMTSIGFKHIQGDHFALTFGDGERWLLEFPDSQVDGDVEEVVLDEGDVLTVISLESLIVDRMLQATDGIGVTFDEATRLGVAVFDLADWLAVEADIRQRDQIEPSLGLVEMYTKVLETARGLMAE